MCLCPQGAFFGIYGFAFKEHILKIKIKEIYKYFLLPTPYSLLPTPYFLLPTPYSLLPTSYSLLPTSYSLLPQSNH